MAKQATEPKVQKISMAQAANQVVSQVNGKTTLSALAEKADQLHVDSGADSNVRSATHHVRRSLGTAEAMGVLKLTKPTDVLVEKVKSK